MQLLFSTVIPFVQLKPVKPLYVPKLFLFSSREMKSFDRYSRLFKLRSASPNVHLTKFSATSRPSVSTTFESDSMPPTGQIPTTVDSSLAVSSTPEFINTNAQNVGVESRTIHTGPTQLTDNMDPIAVSVTAQVDKLMSDKIQEIKNANTASVVELMKQIDSYKERDFIQIPIVTDNIIGSIADKGPSLEPLLRSFLNKKRYQFETQEKTSSSFKRAYSTLKMDYTLSMSFFSVYTTTIMYASAADRCLKPTFSRVALGSSNISAVIGALMGYTECAIYNQLFRCFNKQKFISIAELRSPITLKVSRYFRTIWQNLSGQAKERSIYTFSELGGTISTLTKVSMNYKPLDILRIYNLPNIATNIAIMLEHGFGLDVKTSYNALMILLSKEQIDESTFKAIGANQTYRNMIAQFREKISFADILSGSFDTLLSQINEFQKLMRDFVDFTQLQDIAEMTVCDLITPFNGTNNYINLTAYPMLSASSSMALYPKLDMLSQDTLFISSMYHISLSGNNPIIRDYISETYQCAKVDPYQRVLMNPLFQRVATLLLFGYQFNIPINPKVDINGIVNYIFTSTDAVQMYQQIIGNPTFVSPQIQIATLAAASKNIYSDGLFE